MPRCSDTHGHQILRDLSVLEKWTDPETPLSKLLAGAGIGGAEKLIAKMAGIGPGELQEKFDVVQSTAVKFINKWEKLPHRVSSTLLKLVEEKVTLDSVRSIATKLTTAGVEKLKEIIESQLSRADFFQTPVGRVLESTVDSGGVLGLLQKPLPEVHKIGSRSPRSSMAERSRGC